MKNIISLFILLNPLFCYAEDNVNMDICLNAIKLNYNTMLSSQATRLGADKLALVENDKITISSSRGSINIEGLGCNGFDKKKTLGLLFASELKKISEEVKMWVDSVKEKSIKDRSGVYQAKVQPLKTVLSACGAYSEVDELRTTLLPQIELFPHDDKSTSTMKNPSVK